MITVVVGSNRKENLSKIIGEIYLDKLKDKYSGKIELINIEDMPSDVLSPEMYSQSNKWIVGRDARD